MGCLRLARPRAVVRHQPQSPNLPISISLNEGPLVSSASIFIAISVSSKGWPTGKSPDWTFLLLLTKRFASSSERAWVRSWEVFDSIGAARVFFKI